MDALFEAWLIMKQRLWKTPSEVVFKQGEIWWCSVGMNVGEEIFGKSHLFTRPVLVFKKFTHDSFLGLPLTGRLRQGTWYVEIVVRGRRNAVMLNQARILDRRRMTDRIATLGRQEFDLVRSRFLSFYAQG